MRKIPIEVCRDDVIHEDVVQDVMEKQLPASTILELQQFFKVFADETRLKVIEALSYHDLCVCDISCLLKMSQSSISHQLRLLRDLNLVKTKKEGKVVYYSLADHHILQIFQMGCTHIEEGENEKN